MFAMIIVNFPISSLIRIHESEKILKTVPLTSFDRVHPVGEKVIEVHNCLSLQTLLPEMSKVVLRCSSPDHDRLFQCILDVSHVYTKVSPAAPGKGGGYVVDVKMEMRIPEGCQASKDGTLYL